MNRLKEIVTFPEHNVASTREMLTCRGYLKITPVAFVAYIIYSGFVQYRLLAFLKTIGTKPVNWLSSCVIWLRYINKNSAHNFRKIVARGFGIPLCVLH